MNEADVLVARHGASAVIAALAPHMTDQRKAAIDRVLALRLSSLTAIVEDTYDPHNAAAAIRTSEALGLAEFHAVEPGAKFSPPKAITRGCHRWLQLHRWRQVPDAVAALRAQGFRVYATLPGATLTADDVDLDGPLAVAFGNEHVGLSAAAVAACDGALAIPMYGFSQSFNLSVSIALVMSRLAARRRASLGGGGDLPSATQQDLRARWYLASVRGAPGVVARHTRGS